MVSGDDDDWRSRTWYLFAPRRRTSHSRRSVSSSRSTTMGMLNSTAMIYTSPCGTTIPRGCSRFLTRQVTTACGKPRFHALLAPRYGGRIFNLAALDHLTPCVADDDHLPAFTAETALECGMRWSVADTRCASISASRGRCTSVARPLLCRGLDCMQVPG